MTYDERIAAAAAILKVTPTEFQETLTARTGVTADMGTAALDDEDIFKFGDFREAFKDIPVAIQRMVFKALRGGQADKKVEQASDAGTDPRIAQLKSLGLKVRVEDADPAVLLPHYLPGKPNDPITLALRKRFGEQKVIAFRADGGVAIDETVRYISDLEQGYPPQNALQVEGRLVPLYAVGAKPNEMVDEDPLFPGYPLRSGYSTVNNRRWTEVTKECRQLCRIIVQRGEIDVNNKEAVLRLLERAKEIKGLVEAYPEAEMEFRQLQERDELPKLKIPLGETPKPNNPFGVPRRY